MKILWSQRRAFISLTCQVSPEMIYGQIRRPHRHPFGFRSTGIPEWSFLCFFLRIVCRMCGTVKTSPSHPVTVFVSIRWTRRNLVSWPEKRLWQRGPRWATCQSWRHHEDGLQRLQQNVCRWAPSWMVQHSNILVSIVTVMCFVFRASEANNGVHVWEATHQRRRGTGHQTGETYGTHKQSQIMNPCFNVLFLTVIS